MYSNLRVFLSSAAVLTLLSGCQSSAVKSVSSEELLIEHQKLTHISESARVEIVVSDTSAVHQHETVQGLSNIPYRFPLKSVAANTELTAEVTVLLGAEKVMQGQLALQSGQQNRLLLEEVAQPQLANSSWQAVDMAGRGVPPGVETTLSFDAEGLLAGNAGCNYYQSQYQSSARFIEVEQARLTRQICSAPVMYHENRYLQLLTGADYYQIDSDGLLRLYIDGREKPLLFAPGDAASLKISLNAGNQPR